MQFPIRRLRKRRVDAKRRRHQTNSPFVTTEVHETDITHKHPPTLTWSCSPEYSKLWKMFHVHLCRISHRALYLLYHLCMRSAAFIAEKREQKCNYFSECWKTQEGKGQGIQEVIEIILTQSNIALFPWFEAPHHSRLSSSDDTNSQILFLYNFIPFENFGKLIPFPGWCPRGLSRGRKQPLLTV